MKNEYHHSCDQQDEQQVSKTQIKREMHALKAIGKRLVELNVDLLDTLPLTEALRDAIKEAHRIKSNNARKRHLGFIGKLMQQQDIDPILTLLNRLDNQHQAQTDFFHEMEHWRDRLTGEQSHEALTEFVSNHPNADTQYLRQLIRNSQREVKAGQPPVNRRKLFKYIKELCMYSQSL